MAALDRLKTLATQAAGWDGAEKVVPRRRKAHAYLFQDDGHTPNHPWFPFIHYRSPVKLSGEPDPAALFEVLFAQNGWKPEWRNGIYDYNHFHTGVHEVLGIARGRARVAFGGDKGRTIEVRAGDVVIHPAGVGHRRISASRDLLVVGAYPDGGRYDEPQPFEVDHVKAVESIAKVKRPARDPVYGREGPMVKLWRKETANDR